MVRRHYFALSLVLFACAALGVVAEPTPEELEQQRARVQAIRKNPEQLARLRENVKAFLNQPEKKKDAVGKLDVDLHELPATKQTRYWKALERYADWLDQLKKSDREAYQAIKDAPDAATRLALIKDRRDGEWMATQPKAHRDQWTMLQGEARSKYIADLREQDRKRNQHWVIASLFWKELDAKQPLPSRLSDFSYKEKAKDAGKPKEKDVKPKDFVDVNPVKDYVEKYLMDQLTPAEKKRLEDAEGRWPDFPMTLVEIAGRHPSALPPTKMPTKFKDLPEPVQKRFDKNMAGVSKVAAKVRKEIEQHEGPSFARKFAEIALREKVYPFGKLPDGNEYMACTFKTLTPPMQEFVKDKLLPAMKDHSADERRLSDSQAKWPEYPETIQELSLKYNLRPPWHILPEPKKWHWDRYRPDKSRTPALEAAKSKEDT